MTLGMIRLIRNTEDASLKCLDFAFRSLGKLRRDGTSVPRVQLYLYNGPRLCCSLNHFLDMNRLVKDLTLRFKAPFYWPMFIVPLSVFASSSLMVLELQDCAVHEPVPECGVQNHTLRRLSLHGVAVSPKALRLLFGCFHLVEDLAIRCCSLYCVSFSELPKLKVLVVYSGRVEIDAPSLRTLHLGCSNSDDDFVRNLPVKFPLLEDFATLHPYRLYRLRIAGFFNVDRLDSDNSDVRRIDVKGPRLRFFRSTCSPMGPSSTNLVLNGCGNLKEVETWSFPVIPDHLTSRFSLLGKLCITHCIALETIKISSPGLKSIYIDDCPNLGDIRIEALQLQSLQYMSHRSPLLFSVHAPRLSEFVLKLSRKACLDDIIFLHLNSLLSQLDQTTEIKLSIESCKWQVSAAVDIPELNRRCVSPSRNLDQLTIVEGGLRCLNIPSLVDALLWSCRPRSLWIRTAFYKQFAKVLYKKVTEHNPWNVELKTVALSSELGKLRSWTFDVEQDPLPQPETFSRLLWKFGVGEANFSLRWMDAAGQ